MVTLVARDVAPSRAFDRLANLLGERGFHACLCVGSGKPLEQTDSEIVSLVLSAGVVILGMSSSQDLAAPEILAGQAAKSANIPYGFYGDNRGCWQRARKDAWLGPLAPEVRFYFGTEQADADLAREVFLKAQLLGTGNPLREEMAFHRFSRDEVRSKLGLAHDEKMVLVAGTKFVGQGMASLVIAMEALSYLNSTGEKFQLILAPHPGDRTQFAIDPANGKELRVYHELMQFSPVPARIVDKSFLSSSDMVPGADLILEFGSAIGIEGAFQRVPVISLGFEISLLRLEQTNGKRQPESVEEGISELVVAHPHMLAARIEHLLTPEGYAPMRARQAQACPIPERGVAVRKMADAIERILTSRA